MSEGGLSTARFRALSRRSTAVGSPTSAPREAPQFIGVVGEDARLAGLAGPVGQVEVDAVAVDGHQRGALGGLVLGQVGKCHGRQQ